MLQTVIVLVAVLTAVSLLPSPTPALWVVRALALSLAPPLAVVAIALAAVAAVNGNLVFAVAAAVTAGAQLCVAGAQWGKPSRWVPPIPACRVVRPDRLPPRACAGAARAALA
ncbi:hypothetical protein [Lentzea sp. HUAS12]|uniref:hypothetical protein n=1 Tax=Lentzea sp. HUAS12 TaxID=2951806 RepID=UPI00209F9A20|nr:hypothetical protein [Lentzea sp. HUAS12]USX52308.1 hypothetical protein ND450_44515 [Lentzea sp. HUAS12]